MGYSGLILAARPGVPFDQAARVLRHANFDAPTTVASEWLRAKAELTGEGSATLVIADDLARLLGGPVAVASVFDSDVAIIAVAQPESPGSELVMTEGAARSSGHRATSTAERSAAIRAVADWTRAAPSPMTDPEIRTALRKHAVFAEGRIEALFERLGLGYDYASTLETDEPSDIPATPAETFAGLPGYRKPLPGMSEGFLCANRFVHWRTYRYIPGLGQRFIGIWDRQRPSQPWTFDPTAEGMDALHRKLQQLRRPLELEIIDASHLTGFAAMIPESYGELRSGPRQQRFLPLRDARFVPGIGKGFVGVWDRDAGSEPVVRYEGRSEEARFAAMQWATDATLRHLAAERKRGQREIVEFQRRDPRHSISSAEWEIDRASPSGAGDVNLD